MFVIFEESHESGPDKNVDCVEVVLDVVADLHQAGGHSRARPVCAERARVGEGSQNQQVRVAVTGQRFRINLKCCKKKFPLRRFLFKTKENQVSNHYQFNEFIQT